MRRRGPRLMPGYRYLSDLKVSMSWSLANPGVDCFERVQLSDAAAGHLFRRGGSDRYVGHFLTPIFLVCSRVYGGMKSLV